jgi:mono/diheme cytochrome c family protein
MKKMMVVIAIISCSILFGCYARRSEPVRGKEFKITDSRVLHGEEVFMSRCQKCHPGGEAGLGPAINSNPAPGFVKRLQVRVGLGVMPGFNEHQLSRTEAKDLSKYLHALRHFK